MSNDAASRESLNEQTARAFIGSWNRAAGSTAYGREEFLQWLAPLYR